MANCASTVELHLHRASCDDRRPGLWQAWHVNTDTLEFWLSETLISIEGILVRAYPAAAHDAPVYFYFFTRSGDGARDPGAAHASETVFFFNQSPLPSPLGTAPCDATLKQLKSGYYVAFAANGIRMVRGGRSGRGTRRPPTPTWSSGARSSRSSTCGRRSVMPRTGSRDTTGRSGRKPNAGWRLRRVPARRASRCRTSSSQCSTTTMACVSTAEAPVGCLTRTKRPSGATSSTTW